MKPLRTTVACWLLGLAAACALPPAAAQDADATRALDTAGESPGIGPEARAVLDRMTAYLATLQRFSIVADETRDEVLSFGYKLQRNQTARMVVQRPDRLRVDVTGDIKTRTYVYDGKTLTVHAPAPGVYAQVEAPPTIRASAVQLMAQASPGSLHDTEISENPEINGLRLQFDLDPEGADLVELRIELRAGDRRIAETWVYRWSS